MRDFPPKTAPLLPGMLHFSIISSRRAESMTKHRLLFAALIISIALPSMAQPKAPSSGGTTVKSSKELFLTWATNTQDYALFLPANASGKALPVVMYLHGAGNNPGPTYRSYWIIDALNRIEP